MNKKVFIILLSVLAPICIVSMPFFGGSSLSFTEVMAFDAESPDYQIFFNIRLPRVILAFIAGAALSVCGMCFQSMFRNVHNCRLKERKNPESI